MQSQEAEYKFLNDRLTVAKQKGNDSSVSSWHQSEF